MKNVVLWMASDSTCTTVLPVSPPGVKMAIKSKQAEHYFLYMLLPQESIKRALFLCRYFYRHTSGPQIRPIDSHCLAEIKQRKLSHIICENTDISELAENVFVLVSLTLNYNAIQ